VVSGFSSCKKMDVFSCKTWIKSNVVYVGSYPTIPACFGKVNKIQVAFVDVLEL